MHSEIECKPTIHNACSRDENNKIEKKSFEFVIYCMSLSDDTVNPATELDSKFNFLSLREQALRIVGLHSIYYATLIIQLFMQL